MLRKLRRLRVPVCFYTCCSLCAILLFVSFNEDVKSLIQLNPHERGGPSNIPHNNLQSFSSHSSDGRPVISSIHPQPSISRVATDNHRAQLINWRSGQKRTISKRTVLNDETAVQQYINDNFIGTGQEPTPQSEQTTIVISNLVKLAQQASNNPDAFNNINSLTGETANNELSPVFQEGTTSDTDLLYPGGDGNSQVKKSERQWFMTGGDYFPTPPGGLASIFYSSSWLSSKPSSLDYANLWYDNTVGSDRVIDQLMFAIDDPINYANISWGFEGLTATTVRPSPPLVTDAVEKKGDDSEGGNGSASGSAIEVTNNTPEINFNSRINRQLMPSAYSEGLTLRDGRLGKIKTILLYYGLGMSWGSHVSNGRQAFLQQRCPVNACRLTGNRAQLSKADIVVFKDVFMHPKVKRNPEQLWVMYMLECPLNTQNFLDKNAFNLTATYRHDSDIVTPYEKWVYFEDSVRSLPQAINYAEGKTKKVAWFVSNCVAKNNRLEYARELAKYIEVDIYGACGSHTCSRANAKQCFEMLSRNYKFYLAFENSNCRDYISEKFFVNGLGNNVLPIVMGAHPDDYKRVAPDRSYIHVDDFSSPKELAQYLHELDTNDDLYNEYFKWKGTGEFINTHFFCRLCAMAHYSTRTPKKPSHYEDFNRWWRGQNVCTRQSWRSTPDIFAQENYNSILPY